MDCQSCSFHKKCLYIAVFEPPPPPGYTDADKFRQAPRPYIINPPLTSRETFRPGDILDFETVLLGPAVDALPYFIYVFEDMGRRGLGPERGKYELLKVDLLKNGRPTMIYNARNRSITDFTPEEGPIPDPIDARVKFVTLNFLTPLRLKEKGNLVTRLTFPLFFGRLVQRLTLLTTMYIGMADKTRTLDFPSIGSHAEDITIIHDGLRWHDWERYSRRQEAAMKFGGLIGKITFSGPIGLFMPYLRLGEVVNLGQATTFGLGRYALTC